MVQNFCNLTVNFLQTWKPNNLNFWSKWWGTIINNLFILVTDRQNCFEMKNYFVAAASEGFLYSDLIEGLWHLCWRALFNRTWRAPLQNWLDNTLVIWLVDGSTFSDTTIVGYQNFIHFYLESQLKWIVK